MVLQIFKSGPRAQPVPARAPAGRRIYVIGDIHGRADLLRQLRAMILSDAESHRNRRLVAVCLGDYVDRGLESRQVFDLLLDEPLSGFEEIRLLGNHEQAMLDFLEDPAIGPAWLYYGGAATLYSYGINAQARPPEGAERFAHLSAELARQLPARHLEFLRRLALYHVEGDYLFVHAGIRPGVPIERQQREDLLYIRDEFLNFPDSHGHIVVHGHTITADPVVRANRIGIDTGAFATGRLTCLVLDGGERRFLQT
ncbi:MAG: serine/threonine protein phosphatase [Rhodospirillales bacterium]|nr:serine/threonine protein phosphatase [Rhodospirillales bacterium]